MNERIKELADQAKQEVWGTNPHNGAPEFEGYEIDYEKFAELIVKECMYIGRQAQINNQLVDAEIKEHFGFK